MENKKIKLTISGVAKKSIRNIELAKTQSKNSVVIEKKPNRFTNKSSLNKFSSSGHKGKSFMGSRSSGFSKHINPIIFNPKETAENLRKHGGYVPGIRPGERTAFYIEEILTRLTTIGALYLTLVCLMPEFLISKYPIPFYLGGTSVLIVVVVAMDTVSQIQPRMLSQQYESILKKTKFGR